jgi:predicted Zn-dependent peptidase
MNETKHDAGIHHLVEHILTESWKPCGKQTCNSYWDKKGVMMNASTSSSFLTFYVEGLLEDMDEMMNYMTDIITKPFFKSSTLAIEKHAVLNEIIARLNNPINKLNDAFNKAFFIENYGADYALQIKNLKHMNMKKIRDFYDKINKEIIFVIAGPKKMPSFKENFTFKPDNKNYFTFSNKIIYVPCKQKSTTLIIAMPITLNITANEHKYNASIYVLHMLLFQKLRVQMKLVYGISIGIYKIHGAPYIYISSNVENKHVQIVYNTILEMFDKYKKEPFPQDYIDGSKKKYKLQYHNTYFNSSFMANNILNEYLSGKIISYEKELKDIEKMTGKDFMKYLIPIDREICMVAYQGPIEVL